MSPSETQPPAVIISPSVLQLMQVERAHEGGLRGTSALPVASGAGARTPRHDAKVTESTWARLLCPGDTRHARGDSKERRPFCSASGSPSSGEISCRRGGEGSGPRAEPYKPQRLRRAVCPCLAFLPAAADTLLPTRPAGPRPLSALSSIHCVSLYVRSLCLSVCLSVWAAHPQPWAVITLSLAACPLYCGLDTHSPGWGARRCW